MSHTKIKGPHSMWYIGLDHGKEKEYLNGNNSHKQNKDGS